VMSGNSIFSDTNILLYLLNGDETISILLKDRNIVISFISEMELLSFKNLSAKEEKIIQELISNCTVVSIDEEIKTRAIQIKKNVQFEIA
jgi:predicted nucleic acid-binding protein